MKKIVLASTSKYRREQLSTLGIPFAMEKPLFDEDAMKQQIISLLKDPILIAQRLSYLKGESISKPETITISGDQLVAFQGHILGKPGSREKAIEQLSILQGQNHDLVTACTVFNGLGATEILNVTRISLKPLSQAQIQKYVDLDQPWDCAGSYKIEKHGIQIVASLETEDFTGIQGLPLLSLAKTLGSFNISIPFLDGNQNE